jgi:hypothetical protein
VAFRAGSLRVESDAVVLQAQHDVVVLLADRDPYVPRLRVLQRIHHAFAGDVVHEQGDRCREPDVRHVAMEADRGILAHLLGERLERFGEALRSER